MPAGQGGVQAACIPAICQHTWLVHLGDCPHHVCRWQSSCRCSRSALAQHIQELPQSRATHNRVDNIREHHLPHTRAAASRQQPGFISAVC